jgi:hypothetical protein
MQHFIYLQIDGLVAFLAGKRITVICCYQHICFLFGLKFAKTDPLVTLLYPKMSDQTNAVLISIETKDLSNSYTLTLLPSQIRQCLCFMLHIKMSPQPTPQPISPHIVQLGKTFTSIVTSNG